LNSRTASRSPTAGCCCRCGWRPDRRGSSADSARAGLRAPSMPPWCWSSSEVHDGEADRRIQRGDEVRRRLGHRPIDDADGGRQDRSNAAGSGSGKSRARTPRVVTVVQGGGMPVPASKPTMAISTPVSAVTRSASQARLTSPAPAAMPNSSTWILGMPSALA
jgi:hypothetical protein